ncbi:P2 phage tail completion protein R (GpR) [Novosphingobium sp. CF614]|uniref:phage tail protein n=1 Tax=Novosphingobium sp. CF614 TaxID=1884364 RepID=UPI0008F032CA|nr:phage tail protein [Novosphingobium sp. CF614]SFG08409.1 P2 phage tail completion protein R (GpR) [Novosphingobium sp. CF614]
MRKIDTLRAAITAALPELAQNPDRLRIWIERGAAQCRDTRTEAFGFAYQANVLIVEMASDIAVLALAIFRWQRVNQPHLLAPGKDGFSFDVDILDNKCADVLLQIQIEENVTVTPVEGGGSQLAYLPEPDPLFDDDLGLGDTDPIPLLTGVEVAEDLPPWDD